MQVGQVGHFCGVKALGNWHYEILWDFILILDGDGSLITSYIYIYIVEEFWAKYFGCNFCWEERVLNWHLEFKNDSIIGVNAKNITGRWRSIFTVIFCGKSKISCFVNGTASCNMSKERPMHYACKHKLNGYASWNSLVWTSSSILDSFLIVLLVRCDLDLCNPVFSSSVKRKKKKKICLPFFHFLEDKLHGNYKITTRS